MCASYRLRYLRGGGGGAWGVGGGGRWVRTQQLTFVSEGPVLVRVVHLARCYKGWRVGRRKYGVAMVFFFFALPDSDAYFSRLRVVDHPDRACHGVAHYKSCLAIEVEGPGCTGTELIPRVQHIPRPRLFWSLFQNWLWCGTRPPGGLMSLSRRSEHLWPR